MEIDLSKKMQNIQDVFSLRCRTGLSTPPELLEVLRQSAADNRIKIVRSPINVPIGYVAWASVTKETLVMISKTKRMPPYDYEWREGRLMVIYDAVITPGWDLIAGRQIKSWTKKLRLVTFIRRSRLHMWSSFKGCKCRVVV